LEEAIHRNSGERICVENAKKFWIASFGYQDNYAFSQTRDHSVEGSHYAGGRGACLVWVNDCGTGSFLLKHGQGLFEVRGEETLKPHTSKQDAHIVAHQCIRTEHQHFGLNPICWHRFLLGMTAYLIRLSPKDEIKIASACRQYGKAPNCSGENT
jgi:hypothetical protein